MGVKVPFVKKRVQARIMGLGKKNPTIYIDHDPEVERLELPSYFYGVLQESGKKVLIHRYTTSDIEVIRHIEVMDVETLEPVDIGTSIFSMEVKSFDIREKDVLFIERLTRTKGKFITDRFIHLSVSSAEHDMIQLIPDLFYQNDYGHVIFESSDKIIHYSFGMDGNYGSYYDEVRSRGVLKQSFTSNHETVEGSLKARIYEGEFDAIELVQVSKNEAEKLMNDGVRVFLDAHATKRNKEYKGIGGYFGSDKNTWKEIQLKLGEI